MKKAILQSSAMLSKKVLKDIQSLGLKKEREESGLFLAEGPKIVEELLQLVPQQVAAVYATTKWQPSKRFTDCIEVSEDELQKVSGLKTANQVLAVLKQFTPVKPGNDGFIIYLDTIQDPGNFGTIVRIADWFGIKHIVCSKGCADVYNPKVVQSTMASIARVNVFYDEEDSWLQHHSQTIYAASLHGKSLSDYNKVANGVLLIGNESKGIRPSYLNLAKEHITIQRRGEAESLNAAVATGIILSHLMK